MIFANFLIKSRENKETKMHIKHGIRAKVWENALLFALLKYIKTLTKKGKLKTKTK